MQYKPLISILFETQVSDYLNPTEVKKLYLKAVIHYHPDKVSEEEHGKKWKVLTEEITKILLRTYECYKG